MVSICFRADVALNSLEEQDVRLRLMHFVMFPAQALSDA